MDNEKDLNKINKDKPGSGTPPPPPNNDTPPAKTEKEIEAEAIAEGNRTISFEEFNEMIGNDGVNNHSSVILREKQEQFKYNLEPKTYNQWFKIYNEALNS